MSRHFILQCFGSWQEKQRREGRSVSFEAEAVGQEPPVYDVENPHFEGSLTPAARGIDPDVDRFMSFKERPEKSTPQEPSLGGPSTVRNWNLGGAVLLSLGSFVHWER